MKTVFDGITVVDLSTGIAGPYAAMLLTDMGAECIKVEPKEGDPARGMPGFLVWNRGKRSLTLDLEKAEGREVIYRIVKKADVAIESFNPGQATSLGLDYESLYKLNSRLIYCAIPPFGEKGPLKDKPGSESVVAALAGIMAGQGGLGQPPVFVTLPMASYSAAFLAAYGVAAALYVREMSGKGQRVHGALLNAAIAVQSGEFVAYPGKPDDPPKDSLGISATRRIYRTKDGWILLEGEDDSSWASLCRALGREELTRDPRFVTAAGRQANAVELTGILEAILAGESCEHWLSLLEAAGVPCAPVNYCRDLFTHPQLLENDLVAEHDSKDLVRVKQMGMAVKLSETPGKLWCGSPALGQHTEEVLAELGYSGEDIQGLKAKRVIP